VTYQPALECFVPVSAGVLHRRHLIHSHSEFLPNSCTPSYQEVRRMTLTLDLDVLQGVPGMESTVESNARRVLHGHIVALSRLDFDMELPPDRTALSMCTERCRRMKPDWCGVCWTTEGTQPLPLCKLSASQLAFALSEAHSLMSRAHAELQRRRVLLGKPQRV
jgi:hypothetical protein